MSKGNPLSKRRKCKHKIKDVPYVECPYCPKGKDNQFKMIHWGHLKKIHNKTLDDVLRDFPNIPTMTKEEADKRSRVRIECDKKITSTCQKKYGGVGYGSKVLEKKTREAVKKKYGVRNVMKNKRVSGKFKGDNNPMKDPDIAKKSSEGLKKHFKENGHHCKGKTYEELLGPERAAERIEELRISGAIGCSMTPRISAPQKELFTLVKEVYPTAVMEYPVLGFCIDVAVPELKLAFEYDGSYWHDEEKDKKRDALLEEMGWETIRFVDHLPQEILES